MACGTSGGFCFGDGLVIDLGMCKQALLIPDLELLRIEQERKLLQQSVLVLILDLGQLIKLALQLGDPLVRLLDVGSESLRSVT